MGLFTFALAAPQDKSPENVFPLITSIGYSGAALSDASGDTRLFYQGTDDAIYMSNGIGHTSGSNYRLTRILSSGLAKSGSPLAAVSPGNNLSEVSDIGILGMDTGDPIWKSRQIQ